VNIKFTYQAKTGDIISKAFLMQYWSRNMNTNCIFKLAALAAVLLSTSAGAGEAVVDWKNPEKYTDIRSGDQTAKSMRNSLAKSLGGEFSELAAQLPPGYQLGITVTDLDLAGEVDPVEFRQMNQIRVLKDIYFPRMIFDYQLKDAGGVVLQGQTAVEVSDMQYLLAMRSTRSSERFYAERKMIRDWFNTHILPNVQ
jgi:hypothetical protein